MPAWTVDATSGKGTPANATEWTAVLAAAGVSRIAPSRLWKLQESTGDLLDSIGVNHINNVANSYPSYQQTVAGWSRKAVTYPDLSVGQVYSGTPGGTLLAASTMVLLYGAVTATPASKRTFGFSQGYMLVDGSRRLGASTLTEVYGAVPLTGAVQPIVMQTNRTLGTTRLYTDAEVIAPSYAANDNYLLYLGAAGIYSAPASQYLYAAGWTSGNAEWTQAEIASVLQTLGWTIAYAAPPAVPGPPSISSPSPAPVATLGSELGASYDLVVDPVTLDYIDTPNGEWLESADSRSIVMAMIEIRLGESIYDATDGTMIKAMLETGDPVTREIVISETTRAMQLLVADGTIADVLVLGDTDESQRFVLSLSWRDLASGSPVDLKYTPFQG